MCDSYAEGWSYHRNLMSEQNKKDGHDVTIITTEYTMGKNGESIKTDSGISYTTSKIKIVRLKARVPCLPLIIQDRLRWVVGLYKQITIERPDVIMVHDIQFLSLTDISRYKTEHPSVYLCGDNHGDYFNSARKFLSKEILHKHFYRYIVQKNFKNFDKFLYLSYETKTFFEEMYNVDLKQAVFSPISFPIMSLDEKAIIRKDIRRKLEISEDTILLVHSGKLESRKKTQSILSALKQIPEGNFKLIIIGSIPKDEHESLISLINKDKRVDFLGWKNASELRRYVAAADLYLQPGTQSVTFMDSLSVATPVMTYPHISYQPYFNGCELKVCSTDEIINALNKILEEPPILQRKSILAHETAKQYFDIKKAASQIYKGD